MRSISRCGHTSLPFWKGETKYSQRSNNVGILLWLSGFSHSNSVPFREIWAEHGHADVHTRHVNTLCWGCDIFTEGKSNSIGESTRRQTSFSEYFKYGQRYKCELNCYSFSWFHFFKFSYKTWTKWVNELSTVLFKLFEYSRVRHAVLKSSSGKDNKTILSSDLQIFKTWCSCMVSILRGKNVVLLSFFFTCQYRSTDLYFYLYGKGAFELPFLTYNPQELSTGPFIWETDALPIWTIISHQENKRAASMMSIVYTCVYFSCWCGPFWHAASLENSASLRFSV